MPHRKIRAVRRSVEGAKRQRREAAERRSARVQQAKAAVARRTQPVRREASATRREAALLARELGAGRARSAVGSARERFAGMDLGPPEGKEASALAQIAQLEDTAFSGNGLGLSVDEQILDIDRRVDVGTFDFDSIVDDIEDQF